MADIPIDTIRIYQHYGKSKDLETIKNGEIEGVDFLIGKEKDLKKLTANMAGFSTEQSQRVIIDYDKGYGYFIAKCIPIEYSRIKKEGVDYMTAIKKTGYTTEQLGKAEQLAQFLQNEPEKNQNIIVMMGNDFISGLEVGMQFPMKRKIET